MKLELSVPRHRFLTGENVAVDLVLTNTGSAPVEIPSLLDLANPQPVYTLTGPDFPQGVSFSYRDVKLAQEAEAPGSPVVDTLPPGEYHETGFKLNEWKPLDKPGRYTLAARIDWRGWSAASPTVTFYIDSANYLEASLGVDLYSNSARNLRVVWTSTTGSRHVLGETLLYERRPDLAEWSVNGTRIIREVGAKASEPFCAWSNFDRSSGLNGWYGWREGGTLLGLPIAQEPQGFELESDKVKLVRPALMTRNGEMDVFYLSENRRKLSMVQFQRATKGSIPRPTRAWTLDLPEPALAARAILGSEAGGSRRAVAIFSQRGADIAIRVARVSDAKPELSAPALASAANLLSGAEPAAMIAADGSIYASAAVSSGAARDAAERDGLLIEARFGPRPEPNAPTARVMPLGSFENPIGSTAAAYPITADAASSPQVVERLTNGSLHAGPRLLAPPQPPAAPLNLLRMSGATYLLLLNPRRGPELFSIS